MPPSGLDETQRMIVQTVREIAEDELADRAFEWQGEKPWESIRTLADAGFFGMGIPAAYGGGGMSVFEDILVIEAVTRVCPDTGWSLMTSAVSPRYVAHFGTEAAKEKYLPPITSGEASMAIAISEPEAGSDISNMNTSLEEADDGGYYASGEKTWVSEVPYSEAAVLWAWLPNGNIGSVMLDLDADGVEVVTTYENMVGHRQAHFVMEDVYVPEENVLIDSREDWKMQLNRLNWDRVAIAVFANALSRCAIEKAVAYAETREQFGQPIGEFQGMRWKFADMIKEYEAGRSLTYRVAETAVAADRVPTRLESNLAKLHTAEKTERIVSEALQVFGANGYQKGHPLEYLYRLNRSRRIGHGTDEILKNGIADDVFEAGLLE